VAPISVTMGGKKAGEKRQSLGEGGSFSNEQIVGVLGGGALCVVGGRRKKTASANVGEKPY